MKYAQIVPMNWAERIRFVDWRNPQYSGPFSCRTLEGRLLTWLPEYGVFDFDSTYVKRYFKAITKV